MRLYIYTLTEYYSISY